MTPQAGVIFYLLVFVVAHHVRFIAVIMTLGTTDGTFFAFLKAGMTAPARGGLVVINRLLMAGGTITTMDFREPGMFKFGRFNPVVVTVCTGCRLRGVKEIMMAGGTGFDSLIVRAVVEQHITRTTLQVKSVCCNRLTPGHIANGDRSRRDKQGNGH